ncbi:MAG: biotin/lipoyl-binding protein [Anaerolineales bacterium]|nr:biotin/lipoyl-binding protein [Anaerolineales bacterium]
MSRLAVTIEGQTFEIELELGSQPGPGFTVLVDGTPVEVVLPDWASPPNGKDTLIIVDGRPYEVTVDPELRWVKSSQGIYPLELRDLELKALQVHAGDGRVKAPIPGQIVLVLVSPGQLVRAGQPLLVLEAMKMENEIRAPLDGLVKAVNVSAGQVVPLGQVLVEIE